MTPTYPCAREPRIAVGLIDDASEVRFALAGDWRDDKGEPWPAGDYLAHAGTSGIEISGSRGALQQAFTLSPVRLGQDLFAVDTTIGIDFHWQQQERQQFGGALRLIPSLNQRITVINDVALESYLTSVICSEMSASSPQELLRAHAVISRSWLLAQLEPRHDARPPAPQPAERVLWYDREAHDLFDVCADDHCQRYQGIGRVANASAARAVTQTRSLVLTHAGQVCDARFSKCCGGVTEDFSAAWADERVPYLVPLRDHADPTLPVVPLSDERAARTYIEQPPAAYCRCDDPAILDVVLPSYDRNTQDFFRWQVRLDAQRASELVQRKLGADLGRLLALEPVARAQSGRLVRLRLVGERGQLVVGKELEIRRALSDSHLYSSAFVVDIEGPAQRPQTFVLSGAGWGHGVGLCQIGAAVMASRGMDHQAILTHYYPDTTLQQWYP